MDSEIFIKGNCNAKNSYVLLVLSALLFCYGGWPFLSGLAGELSSWQPGMMTLVGFLSPSRSSTRALSHSAARQSVFLGVGHPPGLKSQAI
jgi:hypothetical protein